MLLLSNFFSTNCSNEYNTLVCVSGLDKYVNNSCSFHQEQCKRHIHRCYPPGDLYVVNPVDGAVCFSLCRPAQICLVFRG